MSIEIRVPTLGESVTEATVAKWLKKTGDSVAADEPVVELETDKVSVEVPAPVAGRLDEIVVKEGETVGVDALLATMTEGASGNAGASKDEAKEEPKEDAPKKAEAPKEEPKAEAKPAASGGAKSKSEVLAEAAKGVPAPPGSAALAWHADPGFDPRSISAAARACLRRGCGAGRACADDAASPDHRTPPEGCAEHRCHAHHL